VAPEKAPPKNFGVCAAKRAEWAQPLKHLWAEGDRGKTEPVLQTREL
jgi:hypothetical protein